MKLLLDGDILLYEACAFNEVATEVEPGYWTWYVEEQKVLDTIEEKLEFYLNALGADDYEICISDTKNFRYQVCDTYKSNRTKLKRPILLKKMRQDLLDKGAAFIPNLEADDVMGILSTQGEDCIIVSADKDMKTIPGWWLKGDDTGLVKITEEEANYWHMYQTIIGDTIDGYAGIKGSGPVAAQKILDKDPSWKNVLNEFHKKGYTTEYALQQARLARILRASDFDFDKQEVKLWTPDS